MKLAMDLTGQRYGRLVGIRQAETSKVGKIRWLFACDCGGQTIARTGDVRNGRTISCRCFRSESTAASKTKHGGSQSRLHRIWSAMKTRCGNPKAQYFHLYGARGIAVCKHWAEDFATFQSWAMANGYSDALTIDRIDNDIGYEPANCRWATAVEQRANQRPRGG